MCSGFWWRKAPSQIEGELGLKVYYIDEDPLAADAAAKQKTEAAPTAEAIEEKPPENGATCLYLFTVGRVIFFKKKKLIKLWLFDLQMQQPRWHASNPDAKSGTP